MRATDTVLFNDPFLKLTLMAAEASDAQVQQAYKLSPTIKALS